MLKLAPNCLLILNEVRNYFWGAFSLDRMSAFFGCLTCLLSFICVSLYCSRNYNLTTYISVFFFLCALLFFTYLSLNMLTFYFLFETTLIPMFLLILFWGARQRKVHAMYMFFFFTVFGSTLLLLSILVFFSDSGSVLVTFVSRMDLGIGFCAVIVWVFLFCGFGVKVPIAPMHTWLPEAHVEAPTVGSIILAGLLLKVGTFGMLRFMFPGLNLLNLKLQSGVFTVCLFSIFYTALISIRQLDIKKIIAYSSVSHMGFVLLGLFSLNFFGFLGSYFTMLSHGVVAPALFFLTGVLYERYGSRILLNYGGLVTVMPIFGSFFFFFILANIGFPFTSNFIGELLVLVGTVSTNLLAGIVSAFSIVLPPIYSLWFFNRTFFGKLNKSLEGFGDMFL